MREIIIALKRTFLLITAVILLLFVGHFIITNDHVAMVYFNPIMTNDNLIGHGVQAQLWLIIFASMAIGAAFAWIAAKYFLMQSDKVIEKLSKENKALKGNIEKVKTSITKCVQ